MRSTAGILWPEGKSWGQGGGEFDRAGRAAQRGYQLG
jgi:hypothetical protein